jgi:hypothetical protein
VGWDTDWHLGRDEEEGEGEEGGERLGCGVCVLIWTGGMAWIVLRWLSGGSGNCSTMLPAETRRSRESRETTLLFHDIVRLITNLHQRRRLEVELISWTRKLYTVTGMSKREPRQRDSVSTRSSQYIDLEARMVHGWGTNLSTSDVPPTDHLAECKELRNVRDDRVVLHTRSSDDFVSLCTSHQFRSRLSRKMKGTH